jgi:hypothetical protein
MILPIATRSNIEGHEIPCPTCKGTGTIKGRESIGLFASREVEQLCPTCHGDKRVWLVAVCVIKSGPIVEVSSGITDARDIHPHNSPCIGISCIFWDYEHHGGCLKKKALLKYLHGEIP